MTPQRIEYDPAAKVTCRPVTADDWPVIVKLFGDNGACGGCWCMSWRRPRGGKLWEDCKGRPNRDAFRRLVKGGHVYGALAFAEGVPVGWCCVGPRADFPRLERTKPLATDWDEDTWSVTCFFVNSGWRGRGVGGRLLQAAVEVARRAGARRLEAYPVAPKSDRAIPAAFAWTGVPAMFEACGFSVLPRRGFSRDVYVLDFA